MTHKHFILSVFLLLFLSGRAQKQTDALKATGDYKYPPYEYLDENDSPTGFNVELLYAIADVMDLDISIELKPWHEARADLESGHVDLVNGLFYSEERAKQFSFSLPHSMVSQAVFCREGELYDLEELKDKAIIVQNGDIMHDYAIKHHIGNELILAEDLEGALKMLENGKGLAYLGSHFPGMYFIRKHNLNLQAKIIPGEVRPYCFGFQKNSEVLQQQLNEGLNILKSNGEYDRIYEKYFGVYEKDAFRLKLMQIIAWMFFIVLILSVMFILWSLSLKNQVKRKTRELSAELKRRCETEEKLEETNHHLQQLIEELKQQEESLHNHYHGNTLEIGRMMVTDAGAETTMHYASDITRTTPVGGKFDERQKGIYEIVLEANMKSIEAIKPGIEYREIHFLAARTIVDGLKKLGLMKGDTNAAVEAGAHALFMPHGLGHMMGLDVHDMEGLGENNVGYDEKTTRSDQFGTAYLRLGKKLKPGFVLTVEPGCYFIPELWKRWKNDGMHTDFINYDAVEKYLDFGGVRIEDDVLVTEDGYRVLGKPIPKTVAEIEALCAE